jgi:N6-L-threonylcarbamoyladenine synthase
VDGLAEVQKGQSGRLNANTMKNESKEIRQDEPVKNGSKDIRQDEPVYILAIETSCDDTSVAIVENGRIIRSNVVSSQIETHQRFGGVVPEIASRKHVESITWILEEAVDQAQVSLQQLSAIAVTQGPGLVGSLLVGVMAGKALASALGLPLIGVHHIAGHIYANQLTHDLEYPLIALVVSGGHTELIHMEAPGSFHIIGRTRDDAAGEAYDKVARAMHLPYPGGPHMDRLAHEAEHAVTMPRAWLEPDSYDFSFSGLKSAVLNVVNQTKVLVEKASRAVREYDAKQLVLAGGVAANRGLRSRLMERCAQLQVPLLLPPLNLCTDNAAMIGAAAFLKWDKQEFTGLDLKAEAQLDLEQW